MKPMNATNLTPDDPKITAYALGELEGAERATVEAAVRDDPAVRAAVEEIRATAARLEAALAGGESGAAAAVRRDRKDDPYARGKKATILRFPQVYFVVGGLAAACFAVMATLHTPPPVARPAPASAPVATAASEGGTKEKVYIDMNALVRTTEAVAVTPPAAAPAAPLTVAPPTGLNQTKETNPVEVSGSPAPLQPGPSSGDAVVKAERKSADGTGPMLYVTTPVAQSAAEPAKSAAPLARAPVPTVASAPVGAGLTGAGETIQLSPFTVSAERLGFTAGVTGGAAVRRKVATVDEREPLPPPPAGARFDRNATNTESYAYTADNDFLGTAQNPFSTFSVDADTASYANVRRFIRNRQKPPRDAVRIEELLNNFAYRYAPPTAKSDAPFATTLEVAEAPWAPTHRLVRIGLKGRDVTTAERAAANLVFLLDVSGSMDAPNRLPLVKESMRLLLGKLRADDRVAIVTYAGQSGLALPSTPVARSREILAALDNLAAGGSTNGAMGIQLAYDIAKANRVDGGINRVILCTDGDFNVGVTSEGELVRLIQEKAQSGVFLTVLGFGMGNLKDSTLEKLADKGNGNYGYIDSRKEAEKLLVQQVNGTLVTIAKDVKIQVEFNPSQVASYRLIGYENRLLKKEDFANDKVDAGEIGAGHTVTALYEIIPASVAAKMSKKDPEVEDRRYNFYGGVTDNATVPGRIDPYGKELLVVNVRYKKPDGFLSRRLDFPLTDAGGKFANASPDFKFAAAVAGFGMILRESPHKGTTTLANVIEWAEAGASDDAGGQRSEFIELARQADALEK